MKYKIACHTFFIVNFKTMPTNTETKPLVKLGDAEKKNMIKFETTRKFRLNERS